LPSTTPSQGAYPRFKYGHLVNCQSFRNPALLAKMGASMQYLTKGRFIMGLGAGWRQEEYDAYNFDFPAPGARVEQLAETIEIVRALWTQSPATYHGKHYQVEQAYCTPQPDPLPPILVGANGKKALGVTARLADGWNWDYAMSAFAPTYRVLKQQCEAIGRDVGEIWLTLAGIAHFPNDPSEFVPSDPTAVAIAEAGYVVPVEPKLGPTPADAIEQLRPFVELGVRHFQIFFEDQRTIDTFCEEVAPQVAQLEASPALPRTSDVRSSEGRVADATSVCAHPGSHAYHRAGAGDHWQRRVRCGGARGHRALLRPAHRAGCPTHPGDLQRPAADLHRHPESPAARLFLARPRAAYVLRGLWDTRGSAIPLL
jgi:alkanesulfonate monooxygenase SsuD/methylene tetrahydromethanopterin reductase-like flavin-dependent oxidoreductase (luciferase family)